MNKQDIVFKNIRKNVVNKMYEYTDDSDYIDDMVSYIIQVTHIEDVIAALRYISQSKFWDGDDIYQSISVDSIYWKNKCSLLAEEAEDALLKLYSEVE